MSAHERLRHHAAMLLSAFELSWVLIAQAHECSWALMRAHWQSGTLMVALGCLLVPMSANGCSWVPMIDHEKQLREAMNTQNLSEGGVVEIWHMNYSWANWSLTLKTKSCSSLFSHRASDPFAALTAFSKRQGVYSLTSLLWELAHRIGKRTFLFD